MILLALLKFLCEWLQDAPAAVQALLHSTRSIVLGSLLKSTHRSVATLTSLLLGMCMEYLPDDAIGETSGGWMRQSILQLVSSGSGGISQYLSGLEELKTRAPDDLLWKASPLEYKTFCSWYSAQVMVVRRRVVQELSGGNDAGSGEDEGSSADAKSLQKLVVQQSKELEDLRESLSKAESAKNAYKKEAETWKRRVESTPSQLDDMLAEFVNDKAKADERIGELEKQLQSNEESFVSQLKEKDDQVAGLQDELTASQAVVSDLQQQNESWPSEMEALSNAYSSLEQEFHSSKNSSSSLPTGEVSGQEGAESTTTTTSAELETLRSENAKLKADGRAADDWMAMAVQRMNDMGAQNAALQQQVASLQSSSTATIQQELEQERHKRQALEEQLEAATFSVSE